MREADEYRRRKEVERREERNRRQWQLATQQEKRRQIAERAAEEAAFTADLVSMTATVIQKQIFERKLQRYDTATVAALSLNAEQLAAARSMIEALLARAYVLPDGRRVFKTEDGSQVFDENGNPVSPDEVSPEAIPDSDPKWEEFQGWVHESQRLDQERKDLLNYQDRLDAARERMGDENLTTEELNSLEGELDAAMPPSVRAQLSSLDGHAPPAAAPRLTQAFRTSTAGARGSSRGATPQTPMPA
tara:strand:+ start:99 stop:839 length:741 start_codon:yes stop_codon:yes gene_type:complete